MGFDTLNEFAIVDNKTGAFYTNNDVKIETEYNVNQWGLSTNDKSKYCAFAATWYYSSEQGIAIRLDNSIGCLVLGFGTDITSDNLIKVYRVSGLNYLSTISNPYDYIDAWLLNDDYYTEEGEHYFD